MQCAYVTVGVANDASTRFMSTSPVICTYYEYGRHSGEKNWHSANYLHTLIHLRWCWWWRFFVDASARTFFDQPPIDLKDDGTNKLLFRTIICTSSCRGFKLVLLLLMEQKNRPSKTQGRTARIFSSWYTEADTTRPKGNTTHSIPSCHPLLQSLLPVTHSNTTIRNRVAIYNALCVAATYTWAEHVDYWHA